MTSRKVDLFYEDFSNYTDYDKKDNLHFESKRCTGRSEQNR